MLIVISVDNKLKGGRFCAKRKLAFLKLHLLLIFYAFNFDLLRSLPNIWIMPQIRGWIIYFCYFETVICSDDDTWMYTYWISDVNIIVNEWFSCNPYVIQLETLPLNGTMRRRSIWHSSLSFMGMSCTILLQNRCVVNGIGFDGSSNLVRCWNMH